MCGWGKSKGGVDEGTARTQAATKTMVRNPDPILQAMGHHEGFK